MHFLPIAVVINDHTLSGIKAHKFIILRLWRPEVQNELYPGQRSKAKVLLEASGRVHLLLAFPASAGSCRPKLAALLSSDPCLPGHMSSLTFLSQGLL